MDHGEPKYDSARTMMRKYRRATQQRWEADDIERIRALACVNPARAWLEYLALPARYDDDGVFHEDLQ